ncbi:MAG: hypothetical protein DMF84_17590 [Acidobacteria bacterium]|nr:MAG: hypothetical protein DMF84_17590 [Acidobacteriota bacterium]
MAVSGDMNETTSRPIPKAPGYVTSAVRIFELSLSEMLWSRRTIFMALVVGAPVLISLILRALDALGAPVGEVNGVRMAGPSIFGLMIWVFYLRFTIPVLGVFYGTSLMADEVEDKTMYLACTIFVVLPSVVIVYLLIVPMHGKLGGSFVDLLKDLSLLALGLAVYGAVFAFIGSTFRRPLLVGLIFIFGWEQAALAFPGYLKKFTVAYYLQSLVPHAMPSDGVVSLIQGIFRDTPSMIASLFWLALIWAVFLGFSASAVERKEYVLDQ